MKFCETCGNVLVVRDENEKKILYCRRCKKSFPLTEEVVIGASFNDKDKEILVFDEKTESEFPTTHVMCPECNEMVEAYWTMQQTRGGYEAPTRFYECKKCKHRWREYN